MSAPESAYPDYSDARDRMVRVFDAGSALELTADGRGWLLSAARDSRATVARLDGLGGEPLGREIEAHTHDAVWLLAVERAQRAGWRVVLRRQDQRTPVAWYDPREWTPGGEIRTAGGAHYTLSLNLLTGRWTLSHESVGRLATICCAKAQFRYKLSIDDENARLVDLPMLILISLRAILFDPGFFAGGG